MIANPELTGAVRDDDCALQQAQSRNPAPQGPLAGDAHRIGVDFKPGEPQGFKMCHPGLKANKEAGFVSGQQLDEHGRKAMIAHVIERRVIDLVALITSAQQFQKIQPALSLCGGKPGEMIAADMGAIAIAGPMAGAGIVHRDPSGGLKPGAKNRPQRSSAQGCPEFPRFFFKNPSIRAPRG